MTPQELLETYDKAALVIKSFYFEKFMNSIATNDLPENFKEFAKEQGVDNDTIAIMIASSPSSLFEVFDEHKVYIEITVIVGENTFFIYHVNGVVNDNPPYYVRREAELAAIEKAFQLLNDKL